MYRSISIVLFLILILACSKEKKDMMIVEGQVKGLKKGTLYLQYVPDSTLVNVDSLVVEGDGQFSFETGPMSPEVYYLFLDKQDNKLYNDRITFFGEAGTVTINTVWNAFETKAVIEGSETQKLMEEYNEVMSRFHSQNLELMRVSSDQEIISDSLALDSIQRLSDKIVLRGYLYTLNFAINNSDSYLAPYLALTEVADANPIYLDSIYNSLSPEVADSKYGRKLAEYLEEVKGN